MAAVAFLALAAIMLAAMLVACGSSSEFKPALDIVGDTIISDDGQAIQIRVWDDAAHCYRPLDSVDPAELTGPGPQEPTGADLFLDVRLASGCDPEYR